MSEENGIIEKIYKEILVRHDWLYLGRDPVLNDKNSTMKIIKWNKSLPDDIREARDANGNSLYFYDPETKTLFKKEE